MNSQDNNGREQRGDRTNRNAGMALDVEILGPEDSGDYGNQNFRSSGNAWNYQSGNDSFRAGYYANGNGFRHIFSAAPANSGGCLAPGISMALFLVCLGQFGLLAAIGFFVFHVIGSIMGCLYHAKLLIRGIPSNPWTWRAGNWAVSFLLTIWLAGGFS